ncbi:FAD/NAD(P)-binding oxidoreductase [Hydrogenibacillus schlegelii]|uniref:NADH dehydrogenase n=1 Tax=Hydrogenibacillus schlegelii TaxID=1484 RepID=A0A132NC60_HYDSH|nr:FAD/NAD(P)-binding oxidoreductase [Hydrogenibacillus schlegelii]KWX07547.1 hypothetical protein TR75_02690 [Hydrogenibacillus schlegelii]OAR04292.1 hypothetical protein SA87_01075 [Hydrogenibacillus schlegelii]
MRFDFLHIVPPMTAPAVVRESPLASAAGWVDVVKHTLQHPRSPNVFALGDVTDGPSSKTGAAIRKQAPVLVENVLHSGANRPPPVTTAILPAPSSPASAVCAGRVRLRQRNHGIVPVRPGGMLKGVL